MDEETWEEERSKSDFWEALLRSSSIKGNTTPSQLVKSIRIGIQIRNIRKDISVLKSIKKNKTIQVFGKEIAYILLRISYSWEELIDLFHKFFETIQERIILKYSNNKSPEDSHQQNYEFLSQIICEEIGLHSDSLQGYIDPDHLSKEETELHNSYNQEFLIFVVFIIAYDMKTIHFVEKAKLIYLLAKQGTCFEKNNKILRDIYMQKLLPIENYTCGRIVCATCKSFGSSSGDQQEEESEDDYNYEDDIPTGSFKNCDTREEEQPNNQQEDNNTTYQDASSRMDLSDLAVIEALKKKRLVRNIGWESFKNMILNEPDGVLETTLFEYIKVADMVKNINELATKKDIESVNGNIEKCATLVKNQQIEVSDSLSDTMIKLNKTCQDLLSAYLSDRAPKPRLVEECTLQNIAQSKEPVEEETTAEQRALMRLMARKD
jgi:hypothetical protein